MPIALVGTILDAVHRGPFLGHLTELRAGEGGCVCHSCGAAWSAVRNIPKMKPWGLSNETADNKVEDTARDRGRTRAAAGGGGHTLFEILVGINEGKC